MSSHCATIADFNKAFPALVGTGSQSTAFLVVNAAPEAGDTLTLLDDSGIPSVQVTLTAVAVGPAGVDEFVIGASDVETAANIAAAINLAANSWGELVLASAIGVSIQVYSVATGSTTLYTVSSSNAADLTWSAATLEGGDCLIQSVLDFTCTMINASVWRCHATQGHLYLAAHFIAVQSNAGSGSVTNKKIGDISAGFAVSASSDPDYGSTQYGRAYVMLRETVLALPTVGRTDLF